LAPRLIVKEPAIGQRSMLTASVGDLTEVILKSGDFLNPELAQGGQLWLVRGLLDKGLARCSDFPLPQHPGNSERNLAPELALGFALGLAPDLALDKTWRGSQQT
jgi:hypothetical protein